MKFPMDFPITGKWPPRHPDRIQLYAINSPNGVKASVMLEETGLPYEPHLVRFDQKDQLSPEFRSLNPYAKIPAIIDPLGPKGAPLALFESAAILIYLADKSGKFLASDGAARYQTLQWLMFQTANISPIFGQVGFFHKFEGKTYEDKRPRDRYVAESRRLLDVLEARLVNRTWIMGEDFHGRGHRDLSDDSQLDSLLRCGRVGWHPGIAERAARARGVRCATRGGAGGEYSLAELRMISHRGFEQAGASGTLSANRVF